MIVQARATSAWKSLEASMCSECHAFPPSHAHLSRFAACHPISQYQDPSTTKQVAFYLLCFPFRGTLSVSGGSLALVTLTRDVSVPAQSKALGGKPPACVRPPLRKGPDWAWPPILLAWPLSKTHILSRSRDQEPFPAQAGPG